MGGGWPQGVRAVHQRHRLLHLPPPGKGHCHVCQLAQTGQHTAAAITIQGWIFYILPFPLGGGGMPAKAGGGEKMTVPAEYMRVKIKFKK